MKYKKRLISLVVLSVVVVAIHFVFLYIFTDVCNYKTLQQNAFCLKGIVLPSYTVVVMSSLLFFESSGIIVRWLKFSLGFMVISALGISFISGGYVQEDFGWWLSLVYAFIISMATIRFFLRREKSSKEKKILKISLKILGVVAAILVGLMLLVSLTFELNMV
ncbi:MAG: hypothetical protein KAS07_02205 [Candidatus Pacebacteria bacterium]|nr:hypothetical protein [Candidatus Paceibacterota bacterium]